MTRRIFLQWAVTLSSLAALLRVRPLTVAGSNHTDTEQPARTGWAIPWEIHWQIGADPPPPPEPVTRRYFLPFVRRD
jgi:hypothetical protein